jgi:hypothetical protein
VRRLARGNVTRRLRVVRVHSDPTPVEQRGPGLGPSCRRAASVTTVYVARGLRLLGQHFTAFVWTTESGEVRGDEPRGRA